MARQGNREGKKASGAMGRRIDMSSQFLERIKLLNHTKYSAQDDGVY
jgi:hypothetical protein